MVEEMKGKKVLVTGATGLLGSALVKRLLDEGCTVVALLRDWTPLSELVLSGRIYRITVVRGELEDFELLLRILNEYEIEYVFHLGAQTIVPIANINPLSTFNANIKGTWNLLESCRLVGLSGGFILASTDKVYGNTQAVPYHEHQELLGETPYDVSKICAEQLARCYHKTFTLPIAVTRCGNMYGEGDLNFNRLIPATIKAGLLDEPLKVRSDGSYQRDFIYVADVADGIVTIAKEIRSVSGEVFNISGRGVYSVREIIYTLGDILGTDIKFGILDIAQNEIKVQYLSDTKIELALGWRPKVTLEEGLKKTVGWYQKNLFRKSGGGG